MNQTVALDVAGPATGPNGRTNAPPFSLPPFELPRRRAGWAIARAAAAVLIILTIVSGYFVFTGDDRPAVSPPSTPAPATPQATGDGDWAQYRNGPAHTGVASGTGIEGEPVELWRVQTQGEIQSEPAIVDGVVYIGSGDGHLYAYDAATGEERWRFAAGDAVVNSPAVTDGLVIVVSSDEVLHAVDTSTGAERWQFPTANFHANVAFVGEVLYVAGGDGTLYALDVAAGDEVWTFATGSGTGRSPAVDNGVVYAGTDDGNLIALDAATGEERWRFATGPEATGTVSSPLIANGLAYIAVFEGNADALYAIDTVTGAERWTYRTDTGATLWGAAVDDRMVYIGSDDANVYAIDATTGAEQWRFTTGSSINANGTVANGVYYVVSHDQYLYALDTETGHELWRIPVEGDATSKGPALVDGVLYLGTSFGIVYAISGSDSEAAAQLAAPQVNATPAPEAATPAATPAVTADDLAEFVWRTAGDAGGFDTPTDLAFDQDGRLWVTDSTNGRFQIFDADGAFLETWGEPGTGDGQFDFVRPNGDEYGGIAFAPDGGFYVVDTGNARVQQFAADRTFVRSWGGFGGGVGQFRSPTTIAYGPDGQVYVLDGPRDDVQVFTADGTFVRSFMIHPDGAVADENDDLIVDAVGNVYVTDLVTNAILKFDPAGRLIATIGEGHFDYPSGLALDDAGRLYASAGPEAGRIVVFAADGTYLGSWGSPGTGEGEFGWPYYVALDGDGYAYVSDGVGHSVQKFRLLPPLGPEEGTPVA